MVLHSRRSQSPPRRPGADLARGTLLGLVALGLAICGDARAACGRRTLWVWSNEVVDPARRANLVERAFEACVTRIYISVYQSTANSDGDRMYERANLGDLIARAHAHGIETLAAYGASDWAALCVNPNCACKSSCFAWDRVAEFNRFNADARYQEFDGWIYDVEPSQGDAQLLALYDCTRARLAPSARLGAAIRAFWHDQVQYPCGGGASRPFYAHVIDTLALDPVVPMCYRDQAGQGGGDNGIVDLCEEEAAAAAAAGRMGALEIGVETGCDQLDNVTFCEEGAAALDCQIRHLCERLTTGGVALHAYGAAVLGGGAGWPQYDPTACATEALTVSGAMPTLVAWPAAPPAVAYDVLRGPIDALERVGDSVDLGPAAPVACGASSVAVTDLATPAHPDPGKGFYYVQRLRTVHAVGSYGAASGCEPRTAPPACP